MADLPRATALGGSVGAALARAGMAHRSRALELLAEIGLHPDQEFLLCELWADDGRRARIVLSDAGRALAGPFAAARGRLEAETVAALDAEEAAQLLTRVRDELLDRRTA